MAIEDFRDGKYPPKNDPLTAEESIMWEMFRSAMRRRRVQLGISQEELSRRLGRNKEYVRYLETNQRHIPTFKAVIRWSIALKGAVKSDWS